ncbi:MAG: hypothetical protein WC325_04125 [Candidatus Bathyarchaeia archaeon]|jgi:hypothetical protein
MITRLFTDEERQLLESYIINSKVDKEAVEKIIEQIKTEKALFDDIFLYLQLKRMLGF